MPDKKGTKTTQQEPTQDIIVQTPEDLDNLLEMVGESGPPELQEHAKKALLAIQSSSYSSYSGPIPSPELLQQFNLVEPGLANRIVAMTEMEGDHRRAMEMKSLDAEIALKHRGFDQVRRGQFFGFAIGTITLLLGAYMATNGASIVGGLVGTGGVVGLVTVFVVGRRTVALDDEVGDSLGDPSPDED